MKAAAPKRCSFCRHPGHDWRKCRERKSFRRGAALLGRWDVPDRWSSDELLELFTIAKAVEILAARLLRARDGRENLAHLPRHDP